MKRRTFLTLGGASVVIAGAGYGEARRESKLLETTFKRIDGLGLKNPIRVLHLSDFHASSVVPWELIHESIESGLSHQPDLIFLTGDFVTRGDYDLAPYPQHLALLAGHPHCYACLGNHDGRYATNAKGYSLGRELEAMLAAAGVRLLFNQSVEVSVKGSPLRIAGLGDLWRKEVRPETCLKPSAEKDIPTLLLAHNPDTKDFTGQFHWDVMFSGHTHGGQIVVPLINWAPALPVEDKSMVAGLYPWKNRHIHITRGVGNLHGIRLNCPPEISVLDLS